MYDQVIADIILAGMLVWFTVTDVRQRIIYVPAAAVLAACGVLYHIFMPALAPLESLWGMLPGLMLLALSKLCGEAVGKGDCYVLAACGAVLGFSGAFFLVSGAVLLAAAWAVLLLLRRKADRRSEMPFMPFLLAAQVCRIFIL